MLSADVGSPEDISTSPLRSWEFACLGLGPRAYLAVIKANSLRRALVKKELEDALAKGPHSFPSELLLS